MMYFQTLLCILASVSSGKLPMPVPLPQVVDLEHMVCSVISVPLPFSFKIDPGRNAQEKSNTVQLNEDLKMGAQISTFSQRIEY